MTKMSWLVINDNFRYNDNVDRKIVDKVRSDMEAFICDYIKSRTPTI
ncbi:hypothetical protein [Actinobacillus succinogenes]|nr:hypothetical protein [Actinobacillus succinogenes]